MYKPKIEIILKQYILLSTCYVIYLYDNRVGLILSIFGLFTAWRLTYTDNYLNTTIFKIYLVLIAAGLTFITVSNTMSKNIFNRYATPLLMLNIFILIFSYKSINRERLCIIIAILFIVITTPILKYKNNQITMGSNIINKDLWVVLQTIVLGVFYLNNPNFAMNPNIYLVLFSLFVPMILHFTSNKWLVSRMLFLCMFIMVDTFN
jgi:hypothetical protein|tara:strand:+ start:393 stop:1010 length:618 start_codon:yes stop_codon:yes gene_type:complete